MSRRVQTVLYPNVPEGRVAGGQDRGARATGGVGGGGGRLPWCDRVQRVHPDPTVPAVPIRYEDRGAGCGLYQGDGLGYHAM